MGSVVVINHLTLDGVMQAPGRLFPDGGPATALRLADSVTSTTGVPIATCGPVEPKD